MRLSDLSNSLRPSQTLPDSLWFSQILSNSLSDPSRSLQALPDSSHYNRFSKILWFSQPKTLWLSDSLRFSLNLSDSFKSCQIVPDFSRCFQIFADFPEQLVFRIILSKCISQNFLPIFSHFSKIPIFQYEFFVVFEHPSEITGTSSSTFWHHFLKNSNNFSRINEMKEKASVNYEFCAKLYQHS